MSDVSQKLYTIDVTRHDKKTGEIYARYDLGDGLTPELV